MRGPTSRSCRGTNAVGDHHTKGPQLGMKGWTACEETEDMKVGTLESIVVPTLMNGSESWMLNGRERRNVEVYPEVVLLYGEKG